MASRWEVPDFITVHTIEEIEGHIVGSERDIKSADGVDRVVFGESGPRIEQRLPELDMGSAETLSEFIEWAMASYPAERYCLVIWNHGTGWRKAEEPLSRGISNPRPLPAATYQRERPTPPAAQCRLAQGQASIAIPRERRSTPRWRRIRRWPPVSGGRAGIQSKSSRPRVVRLHSRYRFRSRNGVFADHGGSGRR